MKKASDFEDYFQAFPAEVQQRMQSLRETIREVVPDAVETISYAIPTFKWKGKNLVHFAGYAHHVGFYPGAQALEAFQPDLAGYKTSKGTVQFSHDQPLPFDLVRRITEHCKALF